MNIKEYHKHPALSTSLLKHILANPKKFYAIYSGELELQPTSDMKIGSAFHKLLLEPDSFDEEFFVMPKLDKRKTENKKFIQELLEKNEGKTMLTESEKEIADKLTKKAREKVLVMPEYNFKVKVADLLKAKGVQIEQTFFATINDIELRCRPDIMINLSKDKNKPFWLVIDPKSIEVTTPARFLKNAANFMYHLQVAVYQTVLEANNIDVARFLFLAAGKDDTSAAEFYELSENDVALGKDLMERGIRKFKYCKQHNDWREGVFDYVENKFEEINKVQLPQWAYYIEY